MSTDLSLKAVKALLPERPDAGHKGTFGHLFVLAGSRGFTGAAKLACLAAGRSGVGLVTLGIAHPLAEGVAGVLLESMTLPLPTTGAETLSYAAVEPALVFAKDKQAVALGPGLSTHPDTAEFVHRFITQCPCPMVIDADGLNALSDNPALLKECIAPVLLTPHPGEMARLMHCSTAGVQADREAVALTFAKTQQCIVVLKGHNTVIASPEGEVTINPTGNQGMAKGGSGDVLSGILGGLLAQGMPPYDAACLGVYLHGLAGDLAAKNKTPRGMIASDIIDALPDAWMKVEKS